MYLCIRSRPVESSATRRDFRMNSHGSSCPLSSHVTPRTRLPAQLFCISWSHQGGGSTVQNIINIKIINMDLGSRESTSWNNEKNPWLLMQYLPIWIHIYYLSLKNKWIIVLSFFVWRFYRSLRTVLLVHPGPWDTTAPSAQELLVLTLHVSFNDSVFCFSFLEKKGWKKDMFFLFGWAYIPVKSADIHE